MIAVTVGDVQLVGLFVDERFRRQPEVRDVVAALAGARLADLHQELAVLRELQHHVVVEGLRAAGLAFVLLPVLPCGRRAAAAPRRRRSAAAVAADPYIAAIVDGDAVIGIGPVVALPRSAPMADQVPGGVKLENRRRRRAAL